MAALLRAYLLMDLRNQQFARATGTRHRELFTPLFWIVSMNLFISCVASAVLFGRVDAYFFALVGLSISMLITATSLIVEFNEVVLSVDDVQVIGHHPVPARTYAAARVGNLLMYLSAIIVSTSIFPAIVGVGLRDASVWYLPAYLAATPVWQPGRGRRGDQSLCVFCRVADPTRPFRNIWPGCKPRSWR
jgi:hypothetical protein